MTEEEKKIEEKETTQTEAGVEPLQTGFLDVQDADQSVDDDQNRLVVPVISGETESDLAVVEEHFQLSVDSVNKAIDELRPIIERHTTQVKGHDYLQIAGWQYIGGKFGCFAEVVKVEEIYCQNTKEFLGYKAEAILKRNGVILSKAYGFVGADEKNAPTGWSWKYRYQAIGMCQKRACSRVLNNVFRQIVEDAGLQGTPAEEASHLDETMTTELAIWTRKLTEFVPVYKKRIANCPIVEEMEKNWSSIKNNAKKLETIYLQLRKKYDASFSGGEPSSEANDEKTSLEVDLEKYISYYKEKISADDEFIKNIQSDLESKRKNIPWLSSTLKELKEKINEKLKELETLAGSGPS